jgi:hypothetical protein
MSIQDPKEPPAPKRRMVLRKIGQPAPLPASRRPLVFDTETQPTAVAVAHPTITPPPLPRPVATEPFPLATRTPLPDLSPATHPPSTQPVLAAPVYVPEAPRPVQVPPSLRPSVAPVVASVPPAALPATGDARRARSSRRGPVVFGVALAAALVVGVGGFVVGMHFARPSGGAAAAVVTVAAAAATTQATATANGPPAPGMGFQPVIQTAAAGPTNTAPLATVVLAARAPAAAVATPRPATRPTAVPAPTTTPAPTTPAPDDSVALATRPTATAAPSAPTASISTAEDTPAPDDTSAQLVPVIPSSTPAPSDPLVDAVKQDIAEERARRH